MKKCPYCAEEIKDEAIYCRYCQRRVKGIPFKLIIVALLAAAAVFFSVFFRDDMRYLSFRARLFLNELKSVWRGLVNTMEDMKNGVTALKDYGNQQYIITTGSDETARRDE